jgi:hypothetical protein
VCAASENKLKIGYGPYFLDGLKTPQLFFAQPCVLAISAAIIMPIASNASFYGCSVAGQDCGRFTYRSFDVQTVRARLSYN